ncbi:hypothetical protein [Nonomuraea sp. NPDC050783]|uniref:hypothetical protein n=1 Tax=Nonomuraea sp. NPDC050783 TaxID=3154634 RepID=UPI003465F922
MPFFRTPADADDTLAVYCLAPPMRSELARSAVVLGLGRHDTADRLSVNGRSLALEDWRASRPADFKRACQALYQARPEGSLPQSTSWWQKQAELLIPVLIGALLGFLPTGWRAAVDRGARDATALRTAFAEFQRSVVTFVADGGDGGGGGEVTVRRGELQRQLSLVAVIHPSWPAARGLADRLDQEPLAEPSFLGWRGASPGYRERAGKAMTTALSAYAAELDRLALALTRPVRSALRRGRA